MLVIILALLGINSLLVVNISLPSDSVLADVSFSPSVSPAVNEMTSPDLKTK